MSSSDENGKIRCVNRSICTCVILFPRC